LAGKAKTGFVASPGVSASLRAKVGEGVVLVPSDPAVSSAIPTNTHWSPIGRLPKKKQI
jgi:hypothetical protein